MSDRPDYALGSTIDFKFTTRRFSTGAPFTLAGTPAVAAYPDNSTTEITAGITLSVDFDSRTGLNNVRVVASGGNGYAAGSNYILVLTAGTVDSVSVVGEVVGEFSIEAQSALRPTTAGRTIDVTAGGEAGIDLDNTSGALGTAQFDSAYFTAALFAADAITAAKLAADVSTELRTAINGGDYALSTDANGRIRIVDGTGTGEINTNSGAIALVDLVTDITNKTGFRLSATGVDDIWDELKSGHTTPDSFGDYLDIEVSGRASQTSVDDLPTNAELATALAGADDAVLAAIAALNNITAASVWAVGTRTLTALGFTLGASDLSTDTITADKLATDAVQEIRNAITGGAYALNTSATGSVRVVDGTGTDEINTSSGDVSVLATSVRSAVGLASANLDTQLGDLPTATENATGLLDLVDAIESGITLRKALRAISAKAAGLVSGAGTGTEVVKGIGQTSGGTTRMTATVDGSGNITDWTLNL